MRRSLELIVLVGTAVILVATSRARYDCANETVNLRADTTCGPSSNLAVTSTASCRITATGADFGGLPTEGYLSDSRPDAGVGDGFDLVGYSGDGGNVRTCAVNPSDAGFTIVCTPTCGDLDAGPCENTCSGTLTPL